ncbi:MAG: hypothetical protein ACRDSP_22455 [Pseudonocardiaceae bacterium]
MEFSWQGEDEGDDVCGRGWAALQGDGTLDRHLFFHLGEDEVSALSIRASTTTNSNHQYRQDWPHRNKQQELADFPRLDDDLLNVAATTGPRSGALRMIHTSSPDGSSTWSRARKTGFPSGP